MTHSIRQRSRDGSLLVTVGRRSSTDRAETLGVCLPRSFVKALKLHAGDRLVFILEQDGFRAKRFKGFL